MWLSQRKLITGIWFTANAAIHGQDEDYNPSNLVDIKNKKILAPVSTKMLLVV